MTFDVSLLLSTFYWHLIAVFIAVLVGVGVEQVIFRIRPGDRGVEPPYRCTSSRQSGVSDNEKPS